METRTLVRNVAIRGYLLVLMLWAMPAQAQTPGSPEIQGALTVQPDKDIRIKNIDDAKVPPDAPPMAMVQALAATGDYRIDGLLSGYKWSVSPITYSFYSNAVFGGQYYGSETVSEVSAGVKQNVRQIMAWYATLLNVSIVEVTETSTNIGLIRIMRSSGPGYAYAYYPSGTATFSLAGDVHLNPAYDYLGDTNGFQDPPGLHGYVSLAHEIGHALGLKHPFDGTPNLPTTEDNDSFTIMTYTWPYSTEPATPMMYDLMALQSLYGAKANRAGNDPYVFTSRGLDQYNLTGSLYFDTPNSTRQTIWDSGGYNTLDLSSLPATPGGYRIDMRELGWLSRVADYNPTKISFGKGVAIARGSQFRDIINSSSADQIYANPQPNVFKGYSKARVTGADTVYLASPDDVLDLSGYAPSEVSSTQSGNDLVLGLGSNGSITIKDYYLGNAPQISYSAVLPSFSINDASVTEGNSGQTALTFTVTLSAATPDTVSVQYATADGTATLANADYQYASGTVTFAPNETSKNITVWVNGDANPEGNETFTVSLTNAQNSTNPSNLPGISRAIGTGTIINDDNQSPVAVAKVTSQTGLTVTVSGTGSYDPDGTIAQYAWAFGDGTKGSGQTVTHTYATAGTYTAVLTVTDNLGATGTAQVSVTVQNAQPLSIASMSPTSGTYPRPSTVQITATVVVGSNPVSGAKVTFTMMKPGAKKANTATATTGSNGVATWSYSVGRRDATGTYTVSSKATYGSQTATSTTGATFVVQ